MNQDTKILYEEQGQITGSINSMILLVTGIGVSVLVLIFVGALGGQTYNLVESDIESLVVSVTDQGFTPLNSTAVFVYDDIIEGTLSVENLSNSVALTNFVIDYDIGTFTLTNNTFNDTLLNATFSAGDPEIKASILGGIIGGFNALEQTGNYLPLIVLAIIITLVLALILGYTQLGSKQGSSGNVL